MIVNVLIVIVVILVAVRVKKNLKNKKVNEKAEGSSLGSHIKIEPSGTSTVHFSDEFRSDNPIITKSENHKIKVMLKSKSDSIIWICPYCETENQTSESRCCVCYKER